MQSESCEHTAPGVVQLPHAVASLVPQREKKLGLGLVGSQYCSAAHGAEALCPHGCDATSESGAAARAMAPAAAAAAGWASRHSAAAKSSIRGRPSSLGGDEGVNFHPRRPAPPPRRR